MTPMNLAAELRVQAQGALLSSVATVFREAAAVIERAEGPHFNSPSMLPPVECPLLILVDGDGVLVDGVPTRVAKEVIRATRHTFVTTKSAEIEYVADDGRVLRGRFPWTYP